MANDMGTEQVAERFLRMKGIKKPEKPAVTESPQTHGELVGEAYDLIVEKEDLKGSIVRSERDVMEPATANVPLTLDQKIALIRQGKTGFLVSDAKAEPFNEVVGRSQTRINEIDGRVDQIFQTPGVFEEFREDLSRQVRVRHEARDVRSLDRFAEQTDLLALKLTREAQVQGRSLTTVERGVIQENKTLKQEAVQKRKELLGDAEVFDRVRLLELQEYKQQLAKDRFGVTPSRKAYLQKIEQYWSEAKKVLLTGETGTGKTETIKRASQLLFGVNPESVTGHQDMSIYELLGKTGFRVQEGDVFRPAPLVRAMTAREGRGQPFLFDEIDRAPTQAVMGIKTILNARPGEKGIKVQTDSNGSFDVGKDYAVSATANIKSDKYTTATELDPAIVRVFDAPMDIDYMPASEVYDLALSSLMDKRGGIPLLEADARIVLKNLCDAASWIQDAYQGRKVVTDPTGKFLAERGQAATGKAATLKKALLDPGRTLDMLKGWSSAQIKGDSFENYLSQRIVEFINNRAYPEEDRYYLAEIFALKGFLKNRSAGELMVAGLTQQVLDTWSGSAGKKATVRNASYLPYDRVVKLDPYNKLKRPVSADAEDLLRQEVQDTEGERKTGEDPMVAEAKKIFGRDFFGVEAIEKAFGMPLDPDVAIPKIAFSRERLEQAKRQNQFLILRVGQMGEQPLTMQRMQILLQSEFDKSGKGKVLYAQNWYEDEAFFKAEFLNPSWALVSKEPIPGSISENYLQQTESLADYLRSSFGRDMPSDYEDAISEFEKQKEDIGKILTSDWREAAKRLSVLKVNQLARHNPAQALYDDMIYFQNTGNRLLVNFYTWTNTRSSGGSLVGVGDSGADGVRVYSWEPVHSSPYIGVYVSLVD